MKIEVNDHSGRFPHLYRNQMKRLIYIAFLLFAGVPYVSATHILGGDITYEAVNNSTYKFYVNIYRDCQECKLAGRGGGNSSKDCGSFSIYLRSSDRNACTVQELATFKPKFESFRQVLPVCTSVKTQCQDSSNFPYGVEIHTYSVLIDFNSYATFKDCGFEVYVKTASRSDALDNVQEKEAIFFNYAYINPNIRHNSPAFESNPDFLLDAATTINHRVLSQKESSDSLNIKLTEPLRAKDKPLGYKSGYSAKNPLSVYCGGNPDCDPDKTANPPIGYYLNQNDGQVVYRPVKKGEQAVVVYQVEQWVEQNGKRVLVGIIRRDIQQIVMGTENNSPSLTTDTIKTNTGYHEICVGDTLCFDVFARDLVSRYPNGSKMDHDSVRFEWKFSSNKATITQNEYEDAPYRYLNFCWAPQNIDARQQVYELTVRVIDNHCPLNAFSDHTYFIKVNPQPQLEIFTRPLECGNVDLHIRNKGLDEMTNMAWNVDDEAGLNVAFGSVFRDTFRVENSGKYTVELFARNQFRCINRFEGNVNLNKRNVRGPDIQFAGKTLFCEGDTANWEIKDLETYTLDSVHWSINGMNFANGQSISQVVTSGLNNRNLDAVILSQIHGVVKCKSHFDTTLVIDRIPFIGVDEIPDFCPDDTPLDLLNFVRPSNGTFQENAFLSNGHYLNKESLLDPSKSIEYCFDYQVKSPNNLCVSAKEICATNLPKVDLKLKDLTVCNYSGRFLLNNLILQPYTFNNIDVQWYLNRVLQGISNQSNQFWLDISLIPSGRHEIICVITNSEGCVSRDTAYLELLEEVKIRSTTPPILCQGEDIDLNSLLQISPAAGVWNSYTHFDHLNGAVLSKEACGDSVQVVYTYDQFGCYDRKEFYLKIECKPQFVIELDDTICSDESIVLKAFPENGAWFGKGVQSGILNTSGLSGVNSLRYTSVIGNCNFSKDEKYFVNPKAKLSHDGIPAFLCEEESLKLENVHIANGVLSLNLNGQISTYDEATNQIILSQSANLDLWHITGELQTSSAACPTYINWDVPVKPLPAVELIDENFEGCEELLIQPQWNPASKITDWSKISFTWNFNDPNNPNSLVEEVSPRYTYAEDGTYTYKLTTESQFGCVYESEGIQVSVYDQPEAFFSMSSGDYLSINNTLVEFNNGTTCKDDVKYHWDFGTRSGVRYSQAESPQFVFPKDTGDYQIILTATSIHGCSDVYERSIEIGPDILILVPSAFTPNGMGPGSTETHSVSGFNVKEYAIWILSRNGDVVYHSTDINGSWDGTFKGEPCQAGVYAYKVIAKSLSNEDYKLGGTISLMR